MGTSLENSMGNPLFIWGAFSCADGSALSTTLFNSAVDSTRNNFVCWVSDLVYITGDQVESWTKTPKVNSTILGLRR